MDLKDTENIDPTYKEILVLFNAQPEAVTFQDSTLSGKKFELHPLQQNSLDAQVRDSKFDSASGAFTAPGRTTAVFSIVEEPVAKPTPTATQASPAFADPNVIITFAGVIGAFVAIVALMFALRPKRNK
jgi:hypothetical protein